MGEFKHHDSVLGCAVCDVLAMHGIYGTEHIVGKAEIDPRGPTITTPKPDELVEARKWLLGGGGGHEDGESGLRAMTISGEALVAYLAEYAEHIVRSRIEQATAALEKECNDWRDAANVMNTNQNELSQEVIVLRREWAQAVAEARLAESRIWWPRVTTPGAIEWGADRIESQEADVRALAESKGGEVNNAK